MRRACGCGLTAALCPADGGDSGVPAPDRTTKGLPGRDVAVLGRPGADDVGRALRGAGVAVGRPSVPVRLEPPPGTAAPWPAVLGRARGAHGVCLGRAGWACEAAWLCEPVWLCCRADLTAGAGVGDPRAAGPRAFDGDAFSAAVGARLLTAFRVVPDSFGTRGDPLRTPAFVDARPGGVYGTLRGAGGVAMTGSGTPIDLSSLLLFSSQKATAQSTQRCRASNAGCTSVQPSKSPMQRKCLAATMLSSGIWPASTAQGNRRRELINCPGFLIIGSASGHGQSGSIACMLKGTDSSTLATVQTAAVAIASAASIPVQVLLQSRRDCWDIASSASLSD